MDMEYIKPSTMATFWAILYSPPHFHMSFTDRHILMLTVATYIQRYNCERVSSKGTEVSYGNELQVQKKTQEYMVEDTRV